MSFEIIRYFSVAVLVILSTFMALVSTVYLKNISAIKVEHGIEQSVFIRFLAFVDVILAALILLTALAAAVLILLGVKL